MAEHVMSVDDTVLTNNNDDTYAVTKCPFTITCVEKHAGMIEVIKCAPNPNPQSGRNSNPKPNLNKTGNRHKRCLGVKERDGIRFVALSKLSVNLITSISKQK